jgi:hypothetical protein
MRTTHTPCACYVATKEPLRIIFCPLHKAAPDLHGVLKALVDREPNIQARLNGAHRHKGDLSWAKEIIGDLAAQARAAITQAEGREDPAPKVGGVTAFAALLAADQAERFKREYPGTPPPEVTVIPGRKYTRVDVGSSGKYMVDAEGAIFGIKGYGVIHRGYRYGTLDTINDWDWSGYVAAAKPPNQED